MGLQKITYFFTALFQSLFSIIKVVLLSRWFGKLKEAAGSNDECVVLGGDSCLAKEINLNINFIQSRYKLCSNLFALSAEYELIKPEYYVITDRELWGSGSKSAQLAESILSKTYWNIILLLPFAAKNSDLYQRLNSKKNFRIVYYNNIQVKGFESLINILFSLNLGMPFQYNVLIPSIFLSLNLGFKKIFILGADHSFHESIIADESSRTNLNNGYVLPKQKAGIPVNKLYGNQFYIHEIFQKLHLTFQSYFILKNYAVYKNAVVQNASSKSFIDAFEKIRIN